MSRRREPMYDELPPMRRREPMYDEVPPMRRREPIMREPVYDEPRQDVRPDSDLPTRHRRRRRSEM